MPSPRHEIRPPVDIGLIAGVGADDSVEAATVGHISDASDLRAPRPRPYSMAGRGAWATLPQR